MTISLWASTFTDAVSTIPAAFLNYLRIAINQAMDGAAGGTYTPTAALKIGGSGLELLGTANLALASRTIVRSHAIGLGFTLSANWSRYSTPCDGWTNTTAAGGTLVVPLIGLPKGNVLNTVTVVWTGGGAHGALPVMPTIQVFKISATGAETALAAATSDSSGDIGTYEAQHNITTGALAHTIDTEANRYVVKIVTETGGNWTTGSLVQALTTSSTITTMTEQ